MLGSLSKVASLAALLLPATVSALLDKPALWPSLDWAHDGLQANLPTHGYSIAVFLDNYIASACKERANAEGYSPYDIITYVVKYDDCSVEWLMCRHKNALVSMDTFVQNFGRVPVRMRQAVKAVMLGIDHGGLGAYAYGDMVVFFNRPDNVGVYLHEVTHAVDWSQHFQVSGQLSGTTTWTNAYNADSAVPDSYAQSAQVENLAQHPTPYIYNRYVPGGIAPVASGFERLANQQATIASQAANGKYGAIFERDNVQCTNRKNNGGWEALPPRRRSTQAERRAASNGPLADRDFPNTEEEQKAYIESKGVEFSPVTHYKLLQAMEPTNCTGYI